MAPWSGVQVKEGGANKWKSADVFYLRKYFTLHTPIFEKSKWIIMDSGYTVTCEDSCIRRFRLQEGAKMVIYWKCIKSSFKRKKCVTPLYCYRNMLAQLKWQY